MIDRRTAKVKLELACEHLSRAKAATDEIPISRSKTTRDIERARQLVAEVLGFVTLSGGMQDVTAPEVLQVVVRDDEQTVWVNVNGECLFRACQIKKFLFDDRRMPNR